MDYLNKILNYFKKVIMVVNVNDDGETNNRVDRIIVTIFID